MEKLVLKYRLVIPDNVYYEREQDIKHWFHDMKLFREWYYISKSVEHHTLSFEKESDASAFRLRFNI